MKAAIRSSRCRRPHSPRNKSARRATPGCAGCNRSCIARITLPGRAKRPIFTRKKRRKSHLSTATPLSDPMKPTPKSRPELAPLLAFGAHPDDIEFGCGGVIAQRNARRSARRILSFVRAAKPELTARRRNASPRQKNPPPSLARRLNSSNSTATRIWKFAPLTPSNWRASSAACGRASCSRRVWSKTSIPIMRSWDNSCATPPARPLRRHQGIAPGASPTPSSNYFITR